MMFDGGAISRMIQKDQKMDLNSPNRLALMKDAVNEPRNGEFLWMKTSTNWSRHCGG